MANAEILKLLETEQAQTKRKHLAIRLAAALMTQLRICPAGNEWVCCLANPRCRNNRDALIEWILSRLPTDDFHAVQLPDLRQMLLTQIESFMEASARSMLEDSKVLAAPSADCSGSVRSKGAPELTANPSESCNWTMPAAQSPAWCGQQRCLF